MNLTLKNLSKNGKTAFYSGAAAVVPFRVASFVDRQAPQTIVVSGADGAEVLAPAKVAKPKLTAEERKALRAAKPKPTKAEKAAQLREKAAKLEAEAAADNQPSL